MPTKNCSRKGFVRDSLNRKPLFENGGIFADRPSDARSLRGRSQNSAIRLSKGKARTTDGSRVIHEGPAEVRKGVRSTVSRTKWDMYI